MQKSLFDFEVQTIYEKPKPKPIVTEKPKVEVKGNTPTKEDYMARLISLSDELKPYKDKTLEQIAEYSKSESDWVRCMRVQVENIKKELR